MAAGLGKSRSTGGLQSQPNSIGPQLCALECATVKANALSLGEFRRCPMVTFGEALVQA